MKYDSQRHHRRSIRLKGHDYTQPGGYFVTIVTYHRNLFFGEIENDEMQLNEFGRIADECWRVIPEHFPDVELGTYVIMPNHLHGIIVIKDGADKNRMARHVSPLPPRGAKPKSIGAIVGSFKSAVTRRIGREHNARGIWQRNYGACPELVEGNTSFGMTKIGIESIGILKQIRPCGRRMKKIR
jgi:REP element-mobilizing transposase RayT